MKPSENVQCHQHLLGLDGLMREIRIFGAMQFSEYIKDKVRILLNIVVVIRKTEHQKLNLPVFTNLLCEKTLLRYDAHRDTKI